MQQKSDSKKFHTDKLYETRAVPVEPASFNGCSFLLQKYLRWYVWESYIS